MGRIIIAAIVIASIAVGLGTRANATRRIFPRSWTAIGPGLEYRIDWVKDPSSASVTTHLLRIDLKKANLRVLDASILGRARATVEEFAGATKATAVINGGFFDKQGKSLGLVVSDGEQKSRWLKRDWGIFLIERGRARIIHANDYRTGKDIEQAIEVGPRLVVNGDTMKLKDQTARRSAIGIQRDGRVILLASEQALSLQKLARMFADSERAGGLGCVNALHLDGGQSSQFYLFVPGNWGTPNPRIVRGGAPVANAIGIFSSKPSSR